MHVVLSSTLPQISGMPPLWPTSPGALITHTGDDVGLAVQRPPSKGYPNLKIALSEGEVGWIPYFLERAEQVLDKQRYWVMRGVTFMEHAGSSVNFD